MTHRLSKAILARVTWLAALVLASPLAMPPAPALAQATIASTPEGVSLAPGRRDRVVVTVREAPDRGAAALDVDPPANVTATTRPLAGTGGPARAWVVDLAASDAFDADATAILTVRLGGRVAAGTLPIRVKQAPTASSQIQAELSFEGETLLDGLGRPLLVRISNLADAPTTVRIAPRLPPFLVAEKGEWQGDHAIPARSTAVLAVPIRTSGSYEHPLLSGRHQVAVVISAARSQPPGWSGRVAATTTLNVGVPGMSEVQGLLQVPSFLLFPGFLLVTALMVTLNFGTGPPAAGAEIKDRLAVPWSSGLWLVAISLSMLLVPAYPLLSAAFGRGWRRILYGFDLSDVIIVWAVSIVAGLLAGLGILAVRAWRARRKALAAFSEDLTPLDLLARLAKQGRATDLECVTLDGPGDPQLFLLGEALPEGRTWATSAIVCKVNGADPRAIGRLLKGADPAAVAAHLEGLLRTGGVALEWERAGAFRGVSKVDASLFGDPEGPRPVVVLG